MIELEFYPTESGSVVEVDNFQLDTFSYSFDIEQHKYQNVEHYKITLYEDDWNEVKDNITWDNKGVADWGVKLKRDDEIIFNGIIERKEVKEDHKTKFIEINTYSALKLLLLNNEIELLSGSWNNRYPNYYLTSLKNMIEINDNYNHFQVLGEWDNTHSICLDTTLLYEIAWDELAEKINTESGADWYEMTWHNAYWWMKEDTPRCIVMVYKWYENIVTAEHTYGIQFDVFSLLNKSCLVKSEGWYHRGPTVDDLDVMVEYLKQDMLAILQSPYFDTGISSLGPQYINLYFNGTEIETTFDGSFSTYFKGCLNTGDFYISGEIIPQEFHLGIPREDYRIYNIYDGLMGILQIARLKLNVDYSYSPPAITVKDMIESTANPIVIETNDLLEKKVSYVEIEYSDKIDNLYGDTTFLMGYLVGEENIRKKIDIELILFDYDIYCGDKVELDNETFIVTSRTEDINNKKLKLTLMGVE